MTENYSIQILRGPWPKKLTFLYDFQKPSNDHNSKSFFNSGWLPTTYKGGFANDSSQELDIFNIHQLL